MKILQQAVRVKRNQIIRVHFDTPVVVKLLSKGMFPKYKNGGKHVCQGGFYENSPAEFTVPYDGVWHAVIEKGSYFNPIAVKGRVEILPPVIREPEYFSAGPGDETDLIAAPIIEGSSETNEEEEDEYKTDSEDDENGK